MESLRKAYGALKDSTKVGLARINSDFKVCFIYFPNTFIFIPVSFLANFVWFYCKDLDIAIIKATNHDERPPKERHIRSNGCNIVFFFLFPHCSSIQFSFLIVISQFSSRNTCSSIGIAS